MISPRAVRGALIPGLALSLFGIFWTLHTTRKATSVRPGADPRGDPVQSLDPPAEVAADQKSAELLPLAGGALASSIQEPIALSARLRSRHRRAYSIWRDKLRYEQPSYTGFPSLERMHFTEIRLWALAFPDRCLEVAVGLLKDPAADAADQEFALYALSVLAREGSEAAVRTLSDAARSTNGELSQRAIDTLAKCGRVQLHLDVLIPAAFEGKTSAIAALSCDGSLENVSRMETLVATLEKSGVPGQRHGLSAARDALEKSRVLQSQDWKETILGIIADPENKRGYWLTWALSIVSSRPVDGARLALQTCLQRYEQREIEFLRNRIGFDSGQDPRSELITSIDLSDHQTHYDDVLWTYSKLGGELSSWQKGRLEHFGLLGDPKQLLEEQLKRPRRWD